MALGDLRDRDARTSGQAVVIGGSTICQDHRGTMYKARSTSRFFDYSLSRSPLDPLSDSSRLYLLLISAFDRVVRRSNQSHSAGRHSFSFSSVHRLRHIIERNNNNKKDTIFSFLLTEEAKSARRFMNFGAE